MPDHGKTDLFRDLVAYFSRSVHSHHTYIWLMHQGSLACIDKVENGEQAVDLIFSRPHDAFLQRFPDPGIPVLDVRWMHASLAQLTLIPIELHRLQCTRKLYVTSTEMSTHAHTHHITQSHSNRPQLFASTSSAAAKSSTVARVLIHSHRHDDVATRTAIAASLVPSSHRLFPAVLSRMPDQSAGRRPILEQISLGIINATAAASQSKPELCEISAAEDNIPRSPINSFVHPDDNFCNSSGHNELADLTFSTSPPTAHQSFSTSISRCLSPPLPALNDGIDDIKPDVPRLAFEAPCRRASSDASRPSKRMFEAVFPAHIYPSEHTSIEASPDAGWTNVAQFARMPHDKLGVRRASRASVSRANKLIATASLAFVRPVGKIKQEEVDTQFCLYE